MTHAQFLTVAPIGNSDPRAMPVPDAARAAAFYETNLGFTRTSQTDGPPRTIFLTRDSVEIGLTENGADPEQASCYIGVSDVDAAHQELAAKDLDISDAPFEMEHDGQNFRVFFVKDLDGLCWCLGKKA